MGDELTSNNEFAARKCMDGTVDWKDLADDADTSMVDAWRTVVESVRLQQYLLLVWIVDCITRFMMMMVCWVFIRMGMGVGVFFGMTIYLSIYLSKNK